MKSYILVFALCTSLILGQERQRKYIFVSCDINYHLLAGTSVALVQRTDTLSEKSSIQYQLHTYDFEIDYKIKKTECGPQLILQNNNIHSIMVHCCTEKDEKNSDAYMVLPGCSLTVMPKKVLKDGSGNIVVTIY